MICEGCKFAEWDTTASGRKSPSGMGGCKWEKTFRISGSTQTFHSREWGRPIKIRGGRICRKRGDEHPTHCDVFQPK